MILKDLHKTLLILLKKGELTKSQFHGHVGAKAGEIDIAREELEKWGLVESSQPYVFGSGMRPTYFKITTAGKKELLLI